MPWELEYPIDSLFMKLPSLYSIINIEFFGSQYGCP